MTVADEAGCVGCYDRRSDRLQGVRPGDIIRVAGDFRTGSGPFGPRRAIDANCLSAEIVGHGTLPRPRPISAAEFKSGSILGQLVSIQGTVRDVFCDEVDANFRFIVLDCGKEQIYVCDENRPVFDAPSSLPLGTHVSIVGICNSDASFRRHFGSYLSPLDEHSITILHHFTGDIFDAPRISHHDSASPEKISSLGRRKVSGRVTAVWQNDTALLQCDGTMPDEFVKVEFAQTPPAYGTFVEAVGQPETDLYQINLVRAIWRRTDNLPVSENTPTNVTAGLLMGNDGGRTQYNMEFHGRTIALCGTVHDFLKRGDVTSGILLECDGYRVRIDCSTCPEVPERLDRGYAVTVSGTCVMDTEKWRPNSVFPQIKGMFVVLRTGRDLTVTRTAPFWTLGRLSGVIAILLVVLGATLVWNRSLRILTERRGRALFKSQIDKVSAELRIDERTRLAVELHDTLSQNLSGIACQIIASKSAVNLGTDAVIRRLETAERMLKSSRTELKRCLFDLRGHALENPNFADAVRTTLLPVVGTASISVRFTIARQRLLDTTAHAVICIIRELASNAVVHGRATAVKVAGCIDNGDLTFSVEDNGCGFDPDTCDGPAQGHFGLEGIRERVNRLNGHFTIKSRKGQGTYAKISIHLPHATNEQD